MRKVRFAPIPLHVMAVACLIGVASLALWALSVPSAGASRCVDGVVDLAGETGGVSLAGVWAFWPGEFVDPAAAPEAAPRMEPFPASWASYSGDRLSSLGYGSYALRVKGLKVHEEYALRIPAYYSSARYFVDGVEIAAQGKPAAFAGGEESSPETLFVPLPQNGRVSFTLVVHLSNFNAVYPAGSIPVIVGSYELTRIARVRSRMLSVVLFAAFLTLGSYFILVFAFRRKDASCLWFGCFLAAFAVKTGCSGEMLIREIFEPMSGRMVFRLGFVAYAALQSLFCGFIRSRFPVGSRVPIMPIALWGSAACALCVVAAPPPYFISIALSLYALAALAGGFTLFATFRSARRGDSGAMLFLAGFALFFLFVAHDLLVGMRLVPGSYVSPVGSLLLVALMAASLMREIGWAFSSLDAVSRRLSSVNESLSRFLPPNLHSLFGKNSLVDVSLGDSATRTMCVVAVNPGTGGALSALEILNDTLPRLAPVIRAAAGFIDSYSSDGMIALFPDDPWRVVSCAFEVCGVLDDNLELDAAVGTGARKYSIGIHRGEILFGMIGESERIGPMAVSDSIETARRLMAFGSRRGFAITASGEIASALDPASLSGMRLVSHGEIPSPDGARPVRAFEVAR